MALEGKQQMIKQLKCLIARQEIEIKTMEHQIQKLQQIIINNGRQYGYKECQFFYLNDDSPLKTKYNGKLSLQYQHKFSLSSQSENNKTNKNHHKNISCSQSINIDIINNNLQHFHQFIQNIHNKHSTSPQQSHSQNKPIINSNPFNLLAKFNNVEQFAQYFPQLINNIERLIAQMDEKLNSCKQQQICMSKKIFSQQKTLKEIIKEYESNIQESQMIEQKLLKHIKALQSHNVSNNNGMKYEKVLGQDHHKNKFNQLAG